MPRLSTWVSKEHLLVSVSSRTLIRLAAMMFFWGGHFKGFAERPRWYSWAKLYRYVRRNIYAHATLRKNKQETAWTAGFAAATPAATLLTFIKNKSNRKNMWLACAGSKHNRQQIRNITAYQRCAVLLSCLKKMLYTRSAKSVRIIIYSVIYTVIFQDKYRLHPLLVRVCMREVWKLIYMQPLENIRLFNYFLHSDRRAAWQSAGSSAGMDSLLLWCLSAAETRKLWWDLHFP